MFHKTGCIIYDDKSMQFENNINAAWKCIYTLATGKVNFIKMCMSTAVEMLIKEIKGN